MQDSLLWVYEGATSYWGHVLGARSGLVETSQMEEALAATAALYDHRVGRRWRTLEDTTNEPIITRRSPLGWVSWQRSEDYYSEGELIWLDADTKIRELSAERRSLDDFARGFFGVQNGRHDPLPYAFEDVVRALNAVLWDSPAFKAGLTVGFHLLAVNGRAYKPEALKAAITAAKGTAEPLELLVQQADRFMTVRLDYHEGLKYPRLERIAAAPDRLAAIFQTLQ